MKKLFFVLALLLIFTLPAFAAMKVIMVTDVGGLGDKSFNDGTWEGIQRAADFLGLETEVVQSHEMADYIPNLSNAAEEADIVFGVGFMMQDQLAQVAPQYPGTYFVGIDIAYEETIDNVATYIFKEQQGAFLVGYLAAGMTETDKIGFVGGIAIPPVERFRYGYEAGIQVYEVVHGKTIDLIKGYTNDFNDPKKGKDLANSQFASGADIVFHASGACGNGVIEAAAEMGEGYFAIGVDSNQDYMAPGYVLTSSLKRVDNAAYQSVLSIALGNFEPGTHILGIKDNGVGITEMEYTKHLVPTKLLNELDHLKELIREDELVVPETQDELDAFDVPDIEFPW
ncbi:MAG: BMP family lipoprotein [Petrotogales bacterium]